MSTPTIGFLGAGHMASAIISGLLQPESGFAAKDILASTHNAESAAAVKKRFAIDCRADNRWLCENADYLILAVKPQQMRAVLEEIREYPFNAQTVISVAAGIQLADYRKLLGDDVSLVRAMPNVAASVQAALTALYSEDDIDEADETMIETIFSAVGSTVWLDDETQMDGFIALSGSGIAYFFRFMQAMMAAGESYGFEKEELYDIISLTALGAATLAVEHENETAFTPFVQSIAVPQGTTEQAIKTFNEQSLDALVARAMDAVVKRSRAINDELTGDWQ
ncbi:MAG: pyrroline-5-carboxylate reductase [Cardiobacteriaceae bacterium]|nr:pyrroline-5-carboxylate reductase [Cardiobacteriaceae bacterium]